MAFERDVNSRFTGMIFLLRRLFPEAPDGRPRSPLRPDMGYALHRPRHS